MRNFTTRTKKIETENRNYPDQNSSIHITSSLFFLEAGPVGDDTNEFVYPLQPILSHIFPCKVALKYRIPTLHPVFAGRAWAIASFISMTHTEMSSFIDHIKRNILFADNIQPQQLCRQDAVTFNTYNLTSQNTHQALPACINDLVQKDMEHQNLYAKRPVCTRTHPEFVREQIVGSEALWKIYLSCGILQIC